MMSIEFELRQLGENGATYFDSAMLLAAADEIEALRAGVRALNPEAVLAEQKKLLDKIERLRAENASLLTNWAQSLEEGNFARSKLVEAQAREEKLRGVLAPLRDALQGTYSLSPEGRKELAKINDALTLPHDDSALKERLRAERERCAEECDRRYYDQGHECAAVIRAMGDE